MSCEQPCSRRKSTWSRISLESHLLHSTILSSRSAQLQPRMQTHKATTGPRGISSAAGNICRSFQGDLAVVHRATDNRALLLPRCKKAEPHRGVAGITLVGLERSFMLHKSQDLLFSGCPQGPVSATLRRAQSLWNISGALAHTQVLQLGGKVPTRDQCPTSGRATQRS